MKASMESAEAEIARLENIVAVQQKQLERLLAERDIIRLDLKAAKEWISATVANCSVFSEPPTFKSL